MSMQAVTIPGLMPVNFIIADCESNWGRWQQLLPLGRSYPIDYLWRDVEEGLPIGIELDARLATLLNSLHHDREKDTNLRLDSDRRRVAGTQDLDRASNRGAGTA